MVKKIRFQEIRSSRRSRNEPRGTWILEPLDGAVLGAALFAVLLLQWFSLTS